MPPPQSASSRYLAFLAEQSPPLSKAAEPEAEVDRGREQIEPDELAWQSRWFAGDFGHEFVTMDGEAVRIVDFGWWNHGAGPDFRGCTVTVNGEVRTGSIELDRDARDWEHHGHALNPAYRDTVLHLHLGQRGGGQWFTRTDEHRLVPQVRLDRQSPVRHFPEVPPPAARPGRCLEVFRRLGPERTLAVLEDAARHRLERKAARLRRIAAIHGEDQMLYQTLADALGYSRNRLPLTVLAQRLPLKFLKTRPGGGAEAEALLFGASGFLTGDDFDHADPETRRWLRGLWDCWWSYRDAFAPGLPRLPLRWSLTGTRPLNHPQRRIAALCVLVRNWPEVRRVLTGPGFSVKAVKAFAETLTHPYWDRHYTLHASPATKPMALLGSARLTEILANLCFPLAVAGNEKAWDEYRRLPAPADNEKSRRAAVRLFHGYPDPDRLTGKLWQQQALLQIYEDFCLEDHTGCRDCPMPEQLSAPPLEAAGQD
ncbi:MAG: hypothetical protein JWM59_1222 [Verrucomicrobiales bacterium]|nr:hypothetical protein [Verrucomicrobiales bacterium]